MRTVGRLVAIIALATHPVFAKENKKMVVREEIAYLAGGCFWGMEELVRTQPGVLSTEVGYTGGFTPNPTYETVKSGKTGHAEALKIVFDSSKLTYERLLEYFFKIHDPTTVNRQGNDVGSQYRSAIFVTSDTQDATARKVIDRVNTSKAWKSPVVTRIEKFDQFYSAEQYHQDYLQKNPGGYTCHYERKINF